MKITSRSILSPGRPGSARDHIPTTLSTSLSRRLKTSRSIKGGASPAMFPTAGKKRGSGFDNPEPSSPKVTCIGQVRVKSKKKHTKSLSSTRKTNGSYRKFEHQLESCNGNNNNNQKWVHIPLTICEALRTFGSEVSCLFPCRSSCNSSTTIEKEEKIINDGSNSRQEEGSTCGAVLARWLVTFQDGDDNCVEREDIEIMDENDDDENVRRRRHVFQDLEIVNDSVIMDDNVEGRVSICVPPKNALLLMRCRSDPMKMEALATRFWEPIMDDQNEEEEDEEIGHELEDEKFMDLDEINDQEDDGLEYHDEVNQEIVKLDEIQSLPVPGLGIVVVDTKGSVEKVNVEKVIVQEEESFFLKSLFEEIEDQEQEFEGKDKEEEEEEEEDFDMEDVLVELFREEEDVETWESNQKKVRVCEDLVTEFNDNSENEAHEEIVMELDKVEKNEILEKQENEDTGNTNKALPECLLLMMYEPKLSMEVSKETWVCSSDFIRRRKKPPQPLAKSIEGQDESKANGSSTTTTNEHNNHVLRTSTVQYEPGLHQPSRSSCSFAGPLSMATLLEQKLVNTMGYEPLVLTRCKSEPMRTAATKLKPDTCYWKNKLEPPRRASFGIGMAGLGF